MTVGTQPLHCVIRTVGERTTSACVDLVAAELGSANVTVVNRTPQAEAVRESFTVGIESGAEWFAILDADVLIRPGALGALTERAREARPTTSTVQGLIVDKLFAQLRAGCPRLHRVDIAAMALEGADELLYSARPDTALVSRMSDLGYPAIVHRDIVAGLHAYEQAYEDLYRVGTNHAMKSAGKLDFADEMWSVVGETDPDYQVLAAGARAARREDLELRLDASLFVGCSNDVLQALDLREKSGLADGAIDGAWVDRVIGAWREPPYRSRARWQARLERSLDTAHLRRGERLGTCVSKVAHLLGGFEAMLRNRSPWTTRKLVALQ